jgi:hypothetical protein
MDYLLLVHHTRKMKDPKIPVKGRETYSKGVS